MKKKKRLKTYKCQLILDSKNFYQVLHIQITKILKNISNINIAELAMKAKNSNCNRLHSRYELIEIKCMFFSFLETSPTSFE